jgi:hypothetical protein
MPGTEGHFITLTQRLIPSLRAMEFEGLVLHALTIVGCQSRSISFVFTLKPGLVRRN